MSFFGSVGHFFGKLFSSVPTWSQTASTTLTVAAPLVSSILLLTSNEEDAAQVTAIIHEIQSDMTAAAILISQSQGTNSANASITSALNAVTTNLSTLLTAGHIKNPDTRKKVELAVNTLSAEIQAIMAVLPKQ